MKKITSLEGIRAVACISIFLCHFTGAFIPQIQSMLVQTPLNIFFSGNKMVRILFVLSGFVVSYKYFERKNYNSVPVDMMKRYWRLMPSILVVSIIICILMKFGLLYNGQAGQLSGAEEFLSIFNTMNPSWKDCIIEGGWTCLFNGANEYDEPLWIMTYEFFGSILVLAIIYISQKQPIIRMFIYMVSFVSFRSYYIYFILGMLICEIYESEQVNDYLRNNKIINNIVFLLTLYYLSTINLDDANKESRILFGVGLILFFETLLNSSLLEKVLGNKLMIEIGGLSYAVYLVHWPIIESFSSVLYVNLYNYNHLKVIPLIFVLSLILILIIAYFMHKYIENLGNPVISYISKKMEGVEKKDIY